MGQIWFKNNKANEKYSAEDIIKILEDTLRYVEENDGSPTLKGDAQIPNLDDPKPFIKLKTEVELYMLKEHGVSHETCRSWLNTVHNNNKSITGLWSAILLTIENRMVYDKSIRPNIQALVLQNKHNYRERSDVEANLKFAKMPKVMIGDKPLDITQEKDDGDQSGEEESSS